MVRVERVLNKSCETCLYRDEDLNGDHCNNRICIMKKTEMSNWHPTYNIVKKKKLQGVRNVDGNK